jgi:hypothetical protein
MRKILMAVAALLVMAGRGETQGVATQNVNLTANVGGYCTVDGTATGTVRSAVVPTSNGKVAGGSLTLSGASGKVICTTNAKIQLKTASGGLTNGPAPTDVNFTNKVHFTATASYNGKTEQLITTDATPPGFTTPGTDTVGGPQTNQDLVLAVTVAATPAGKFLVSGAYSDTLTVTLTPVP